MSTHAYEADSIGPPKRKLYVWQDDPDSGWCFAVSFFDEANSEQPLWDTWERSFHDILRYPAEYAPTDIAWRDADSSEPVDLYQLKH